MPQLKRNVSIVSGGVTSSLASGGKYEHLLPVTSIQEIGSRSDELLLELEHRNIRRSDELLLELEHRNIRNLNAPLSTDIEHIAHKSGSPGNIDKELLESLQRILTIR